jgi:hypothetical protein
MDDFDRRPGAIDDPGLNGGIDPQLDNLPVGSGAGDTGAEGEPSAGELDLPGPDDPVAWTYVQADTIVVGHEGQELGRVAAMLGTETEGIFHGIAVTSYRAGSVHVVPADAVVRLTPSEVVIAMTEDELEAAERAETLVG